MQQTRLSVCAYVCLQMHCGSHRRVHRSGQDNMVLITMHFTVQDPTHRYSNTNTSEGTPWNARPPRRATVRRRTKLKHMWTTDPQMLIHSLSATYRTGICLFYTALLSLSLSTLLCRRSKGHKRHLFADSTPMCSHREGAGITA